MFKSIHVESLSSSVVRIAALVILAAPAWCQDYRATITGTVTDQQNAAVASAAVATFTRLAGFAGADRPAARSGVRDRRTRIA